MESYRELPPNLPVPEDDGAAAHLRGARLPHIVLSATSEEPVDLAVAADGLLVLYVYPSTGVPGRPMPEGWDEIPGARGCTPHNCAFRDLAVELRDRGARLHGCSSQSLEEQREFAERERIAYPLLNDSELRLAADPGLPTFEVEGRRLYKRITLIVRGGEITDVIYPVFPPGTDARAALELIA